MTLSNKARHERPHITPFIGDVWNRQIHRDRRISAWQGVREREHGDQTVTLLVMGSLSGDDGNAQELHGGHGCMIL